MSHAGADSKNVRESTENAITKVVIAQSALDLCQEYDVRRQFRALTA